MDKQPHVSYSKFYKPKDVSVSISELFPEYLVYRLKNKDKPQERINYRQYYKTKR